MPHDAPFSPDQCIDTSDGGDAGEKKPTQRDLIVACAKDVEFWHDADRTAYATIDGGSHKEHHLVRSRLFRDWLGHAYYNKHDSAPSAQATEDALRALEARAKFDGREHSPAVRVGEHGGNVYVDLCDEAWRAIEVTPTGWRVVDDVPVRFIRPRGMRPLPTPVAGGSVDELRAFVNVNGDGQFKLIVAWLLMALCPRGPYPILTFGGEQGSAKSTTARVLRGLVDPSSAPLRSPPREERDLLIAARNSWAVSFDNLSRVPEWLGDALCRLATGGGYSARQLYTDSDEVIFEAMRPVTLNGIPDLATRGDVADRAMVVTLPNIPDGSRRPEKQFWNDFDARAGRILGALLDAVSCALTRQDHVAINRLPRMSDFALWVTAAEPALGWAEGSFIRAYRENLETAVGLTVEADPVAIAVQKLIEAKGAWSGSASELLADLDELVTDATRRTKEWPKAANVLSARVKRAAPGLRASGIDVEHGRQKGQSHISLSRMENVEEKDRHHRHPGPQSGQDVKYSKHLAGGDGGGDPGGDGGDGGDPAKKTAALEIGIKPLENNSLPVGGGDGGDLLQPLSTSDDEEVEWSA